MEVNGHWSNDKEQMTNDKEQMTNGLVAALLR
jgi:hypothetical protein